jgi:RNase P subunit RPR2
LKLLYIDIETSPILGWTWGFYQTDVLRIYEDWRLLGYAYAWGDHQVQSKYPSPKGWTKDPPGPSEARDEEERKLLEHVHGLLDKADIIIAHNGNRFDIRKLQAKFVEYELGPTSPFLSIDTLKEARKYGMFTSNRLDSLGRLLDLGGKESLPMLKTQMAVMNPDSADKAFRDMKKYNRRDVDLLRDLYKKLLPYMKKHPQVHSTGCPTCGSENLHARGNRYTEAGVAYKVYQCQDCGRYHSDRKMFGKVNQELR